MLILVNVGTLDIFLRGRTTGYMPIPNLFKAVMLKLLQQPQDCEGPALIHPMIGEIQHYKGSTEYYGM